MGIGRKLISLSRTVSQRLLPDDHVPGVRLRYTLNQLQKMEFALRGVGRSFQACSSILEFGCGSGRLTRHLLALVPAAAIVGCDVVRQGVETCRRRYPSATFVRNEWCPPLPFDDGRFDLVFSYSVFTHLSEPNHRDWLKELARVLRADGVMLHTTHSHECLARMAMFSPGSLAKYALRTDVPTFVAGARSYHYTVDDPARPEYGLAIIGEAYVREWWPRYSGLRLAAYTAGAIEAYPEGCQDIVILQKS